MPPGTLANLMRSFTDLALPGTPPSAREAEQAAQSLRLRGFQTPSWASLLDGTDGANPAGEEDSSLKSRRGVATECQRCCRQARVRDAFRRP